MRTIYCRLDVLLFGYKHVSKQWESVNGIRYVLASDNFPSKDWAREIIVEHGERTANDIKITCTGSKRAQLFLPAKE